MRNEQWGFRRGHSTTMQLMRHVENITRGFNQNRATVALYLDIKQAFDKVWHSGLIRKMIDYNIDDGIVCLISSYLSDRKFHTKWENELSETKNINSGVAQGSLIGPTLFNIYINDIPHPPQHNYSALHIFADDTLITGQSHRPEYAVRQVQQSLALIEPWLEKWRIRINPDKCQAVVFSKKWKHINERCTPIRINGSDINWTTEAKYLGVILDQKLLFRKQIETNVNKAYGMLKRLFPIIKNNQNYTTQ
jgi:Reverse transcriptase (RNA-dependent DNA polymerase).